MMTVASNFGEAVHEPWPPFRVLYVDDNRDCADSAVLLFRLMGFEARACYDGDSALVVNERFQPAICFLDLNMPGMAGDELALRLRDASWTPLWLVAVTAMSSQASQNRIERAGFALHLVKPVDPRKLLAILDQLFLTASTYRLTNQESYEARGIPMENSDPLPAPALRA